MIRYPIFILNTWTTIIDITLIRTTLEIGNINHNCIFDIILYKNDLGGDKVGLMWMKPVVDYMTGEDYTHCHHLYSQDIT